MLSSKHKDTWDQLFGKEIMKHMGHDPEFERWAQYGWVEIQSGKAKKEESIKRCHMHAQKWGISN